MIRTANLIGSISRKAGGLHESVRRLVQSLDGIGVGVRVLTVEDEFTHLDAAVWAPVAVNIFPRSWPEDFGYSPGFLRVLDEYQPDLTHTHGIWMYPSIATAAYCTRRHVPYMVSPHGMLDPWAVRHHHWKKVLAYALYEINHVRAAHCIRALCESEARSIREMRLTNPTVVIPNGIDLPEIGAATDLMAKAPWDGFVEPGRKVILFLSRIHPKKGLTNLLRAWAATSKPSAWVLAIAGWDQDGHEAELKRLCDELEIAWADVRDTSDEKPPARTATVLFLGPQFEQSKASCYRNCDVFILPSFSEGLPMVVLEAWAFAKPVLMTPECNLPEGFAAQAAVQIDTTVDGISEGLRSLHNASDSTLSEIGLRGRNLAEERFSWEGIAAKMKSTYEWMLGGGTEPDCVWTD